MKPLEELRHEHLLIRRMLDVLDVVRDEVNRAPADTTGSLRDAIRFFRGFAECHHSKEENGLFPVLSPKNATVANGPLRVLSSEHDAGRTMIQDIEAHLPGIEEGDLDSQEAVARALTLYVRMLRKHIEKEEDILFPLAEVLIAGKDEDSIEEQFLKIESAMGPGAHATFEAIVESLEERFMPHLAGSHAG